MRRHRILVLPNSRSFRAHVQAAANWLVDQRARRADRRRCLRLQAFFAAKLDPQAQAAAARRVADARAAAARSAEAA